MRTELPSGTVTFLFTDIEGSTRLLHDLGPAGYADALAEHRRILRQAFAEHGGVEVDTQGDAFFVAFPTAQGAVDAALGGVEALTASPIRVRVGIHTGAPHLTDEGYVGEDVHRGARIGAAGHGGQVLLSNETRALVDAEVTDLGEHRLKDFGEPVWIFQLGTATFPPLKTISNTNLPRPASSFVGREREVAEVTALLADGARLVTLSGPGGTGKTRLAIEAAAGLVPRFRNGVFWVGLSALRDPALVTETIATTLGAKDELAQHIGAREMLLLLDNLEQVVGSAPELAGLLEGCPNLRLLVTSRELLRVRGEVVFPVPPMATNEAVRLFCLRAGLAPDGVIGDLCRRLDDLPLAVELAAARVTVLSPAKILERLSHRLDLLAGGRDADPRQQTLRATIEWSHDLLDEGERRLFARLGVFGGGFTLGTAEAVVDADLDTLGGLVEKSLVRRTRERYWMLETIGEYAIERLDASTDAREVRGRHADHYLALAEEAKSFVRAAVLRGYEGEPGRWVERLEAEVDNVRSALDHLEATGRLHDALRLAGAMHEFWFETERYSEGAERLRHLLELQPEPTAARGSALLGLCDVQIATGDSSHAPVTAEEALEIFRAVGDPFWIAEGQWAVGVSHSSAGRFAEALPHLQEAFDTFRELGDDDSFLGVGWPIVWSLENCGELERSWETRRELLERARASGNAVAQMRMLGGLSLNALDLGRPTSEALALVHEHLPFALAQNQQTIGIALSRCAHVLARTGSPDPAARILARAGALFDELGVLETWVGSMNEETQEAVRSALGEDAFVRAIDEGHALTIDEAVELALFETGERS